MKSYIITALALLSLIMTGCQSNPSVGVVSNKNNGEFETDILITNDIEEYVASEEIHYQDVFVSVDGSIEYTVDLDASYQSNLLPVIQVSPHTISSLEAERVARVLFGDEAKFYEYSEEMSKSELESVILSLKQVISDREYLLKYYDGDEELVESLIAQYEMMIESYVRQYEVANNTVQDRFCDWTFQPKSYYEDHTGLDTTTEEYRNESKSRYIYAIVENEGVPYKYSVCIREEDDYRINNIAAYVHERGNPGFSVNSTEIPTEEDIEAAKSKAEVILEELPLGNWVVDSIEVKELEMSDAVSEYMIIVTACPVYNGVKVTHQEQLINLKSEDQYASNYYYESIEFEFSGDRLIKFDYRSPLDIVDVINENVDILSFDEIVEQFKTQMRLNKSILASSVILGEEVFVNRVEMGLTRTRIKNNEQDFYLVPTFTFYGINGYDSSQNGMTEEVQLAVINAVDGSIINTQLGY